MSTLVITGWTSGLWKDLVKKFVAWWWHAVVLARDAEKWRALQAELWADKVTYYPCDIRDRESLTKVFSEIKEIDCLINNSGIGYWENTYEETLEHIEDTIQTNLIGAMRCTRLALPTMIAKKAGVIINIGSIYSTRFRPGASAYATSKAWLKMYTDVVRAEVREFGIKVLSIFPGAMKTPIREEEEIEKYGHMMMESADVAKVIFEAHNTALTWVVQEDIFISPACGDVKF